MKKAAIIFLVFLYAFSTTGVAVKGNYCCDKLKSVKLVLANDAKDKNGCCGIKYQSFKIKDAHAASDVAVTTLLNFAFIDGHNYIPYESDLFYEVSKRSINIHSPPLYPPTPLYLSNCVFRI